MTHTLKMFNTGQVTLPKAWRDRFDTNNFVAIETDNGLLIRPLLKDETVFYEDKQGFGLYCADGLDAEDIAYKIKKLNG